MTLCPSSAHLASESHPLFLSQHRCLPHSLSSPAFGLAACAGLKRPRTLLLHFSHQCISPLHSHERGILFRARCGPMDDSLEEPKWKQKLAAVDEVAERSRLLAQQVQDEYKKKQELLSRQQLSAKGEISSLGDLKFIPYLNDEGLITNCSRSDAKASVYAIYDEHKALQYIGVSRQVYMSMRLHFARMPSKCHYIKVQHITMPSRFLLEFTREKWIDENGACPNGNDNGTQQYAWENAIDCKPLMTEEEMRKLDEAGLGPPKAKVLKNIARRVESELDKYFLERNCKENLRFDPKLKEKGLLDLKNVQAEPNKSVPTTSLKTASASAA